jgi:hypothetical protein
MTARVSDRDHENEVGADDERDIVRKSGNVDAAVTARPLPPK